MIDHDAISRILKSETSPAVPVNIVDTEGTILSRDMTPDLQAAVERYRQHKAAVDRRSSPYWMIVESPGGSYGEMDRRQINLDRLLIADAYLELADGGNE